MKKPIIALAAISFTSLTAAQFTTSAQLTPAFCTKLGVAQASAVIIAYENDGSEAYEKYMLETIFIQLRSGDSWVRESTAKALIADAKTLLEQSKPKDIHTAGTLANTLGSAQRRSCNESASRTATFEREKKEADMQLSVKGYFVGQRQSSCPIGSKPETPKPKAVVTCEFGSTSYGGANAKNFTLFLFEGKVLGAFVEFGFGGKNNHFTLRDALTQKYGTPSDNQKAINAYTWRQGTVSLTLNGLEGHVTLTDQTAFDRAKKLSAEEAQKDL
ncbi:hypothetical protein [Rhodoferax bucti]|uniref:hypothetical protein n=1 Tax=Rhodoferax bucti TaxID=2576305 RepID=UPI0011099292|nr:hypothetical protein [Rhodoferax bucti]